VQTTGGLRRDVGTKSRMFYRIAGEVPQGGTSEVRVRISTQFEHREGEGWEPAQEAGLRGVFFPFQMASTCAAVGSRYAKHVLVPEAVTNFHTEER
jgi:hypothetical protein